jgi:hypothetical protein
VVGGGTPQAWVAWGTVPAFGFGIAPEGILARIPGEDARDPEPDYRDFAAWAVPRGITLVRSHPPFVAVGPDAPDLLARGADGRFDPDRFRDEYFERLRVACTELRDVGIFVQLRIWDASSWTRDGEECIYHPSNLAAVPWAEHAGPGRFVVDPGTAPGLIAHQREHLRRVLDATGDLGNVFYELAAGMGDGFGESAAWVETMLDEVTAWETAHGNVLIGLEDDGEDRAEAGRPASNPRLDVVFADPGRPERHARIRELHGKPTFSGAPRGLRGDRDPALSPEGTAEALRILWRTFLARCQMACVPTEWGASAYRAGPLAGLAPERLPGNDVTDVRSIYGPAGTFPEAVEETAAPHARVLVLPRRDYFALHREPARGWVMLEADPERTGVPLPASTLRLTGLSYLSAEPPHDIKARLIRPGSGERAEQATAFRIDDLALELPAYTDAIVVSLRRHFPPDFVRYVAAPPGEEPVSLNAAVEGQTVTLTWERNLALPEWSGTVAWIQRPPGEEWLACTAGTSFTDAAAPPGKHVYMLAWREDARSPTAIRSPGIAVVDVPDVAPEAPRIVPLRSDGAAVVLWARSRPAADPAVREWEQRTAGAEWAPVVRTPGFLLEASPEPGAATEYRVRVVDAAGNAGPFSEPAVARP